MSFVCHSYVNRMSLGCHSYLPVCHQYVTRIHSYVIRIHSHAIHMSLVFTRVSFICHSYVLVCYSYVTRMLSVRHSYVLVCHPYVTRMLLVCDFTMIRYKLGIHGFVTRLLVGTFVTSVWYFGILFKLHLTVRFSSCSLKLLFNVNFKDNGFIIICKSFLQRYK